MVQNKNQSFKITELQNEPIFFGKTGPIYVLYPVKNLAGTIFSHDADPKMFYQVLLSP